MFFIFKISSLDFIVFFYGIKFQLSIWIVKLIGSLNPVKERTKHINKRTLQHPKYRKEIKDVRI